MDCQDATYPKACSDDKDASSSTPASSAGDQIENDFLAVPTDRDDGNHVSKPPTDVLGASPSDMNEAVGNASTVHRSLTTSDHLRSWRSKTPNDSLLEGASDGREVAADVSIWRRFSWAFRADSAASRGFAPTPEENTGHSASEDLPFESSSRTQPSNVQGLEESMQGVIVVDATLVRSNRRSRNEQPRGQQTLVRAQLYRPGSKRWRLVVGLIALLVLIGALATGIGLGLSRKPDPGTREDPPTAAPTMSAVRSEWIHRAHLFPSTLKALQIPDSPQSQALSWVLENAVEGYGSALPFEREKQRFALAALYFALDVPESLLKDAWMSLDQHECNWKGVACSNESVEALTLSGEMSLQGFIAPEVGLLTALASLSISLMGGLKRGIPEEIGYNHHLTSLVLSKNGLTGSFPNEVDRLRSLVLLDVSENSLTGTIPTEISNMTSLQVIQLSDNALGGAIPSVSQMKSLKTLSVYGNLLVGTVPTDFSGLTQLERFHLANNRLTGSIPAALGHARNLTYVSLRGNPLSGTVPPELGLLSNLVRLHVDTTEITGTVPTEIFGMRSLQTLRLNDNQLSGSIPPHVGNLTSATTLLLDGNQFTGTIPTAWVGLSNLRELQMNGNDLSGPIPSELGLLSNLKVLLLQGNRNVTGTVPSELCSLTRDRGLNLTLDCEGVEFNRSSCSCQSNVVLFSDP